MRNTVRRFIAGGLIPVLAGTWGCGGGTKHLEREDLDNPPAASSYRVATQDGRKLTFIALHLEAEDLVGTVRQTRSETVGEGDAARTNVTNRYEEVRVPWEEVVSVEAEGGKGGPSGALLAGGAIALGAVAFLLFTSGSDSPDTSGGGKGF